MFGLQYDGRWLKPEASSGPPPFNENMIILDVYFLLYVYTELFFWCTFYKY